jgi:alkanesulfonate monooxygenase SsuD/methylene tetrahydromethanopterin reductase-like flavin-dependent oxidoreductase (luciferase family)
LRGLFFPPFDELFDPRRVASLATVAEEAGWDGLFLWDHISYLPPVRDVADPWIVLAAVAGATERLRLGPLVTPLPRRRVEKLARETVTLDHLSHGRLTLGVGIGSNRYNELSLLGEPLDAQKRAALLDRDLARLADLWDGGFTPAPVQRPRIPVWVACRWPSRRPLVRAARWEGLFPIELPDPGALEEMALETARLRPAGSGPFDLIVEIAPGEDPFPWESAGATWVLTSFGHEPRFADVLSVARSGPR